MSAMLRICAASAAILTAAPALAQDVSGPGQWTCVSQDGWEYAFDVHSVDGGMMSYSMGQIDPVSQQFEVTCKQLAPLAFFNFCRDVKAVGGAPSEAHDRVRAECGG